MVQKALRVMNSAVNKGCLQSTDHFPCKNQAVQYCPHTTQPVPSLPERKAGKDGLQASPVSSKDDGLVPLSSASLAGKHHNEQSKLTSFRREDADFWLIDKFMYGARRCIIVGKYPSKVENLKAFEG